MKVQKIKLNQFDYSWLVLDNNHLPIKPITDYHFHTFLYFYSLLFPYIIFQSIRKHLLSSEFSHSPNCLPIFGIIADSEYLL